MKKADSPSELFVNAIKSGYIKAEAEGTPVTCSKIWDYVVVQCLRKHKGFITMFAWDTSTAKSKNRINDIAQCIERGHVPGLRLRYDGRKQFVERAI